MDILIEIKKEEKNALINKLSNGITILTVLLGVWGYIYLCDNYVHENICTKSNSFRWVRVVYAIVAVLFALRIKRGKPLLRIENRLLKWGYLLLIPAAAFLIEEIVWNEAIGSISFLCISVNYILILFITLFLLALIRIPWLAYLIVISSSLLYGIVNHYVLLFKGCPPLIRDVLAAGTAVTVMGNYEYVLTDAMLLGILLFLAVALLLFYFPPCRLQEKAAGKVYIRYGISVIAACLAVAVILNYDVQNHLGISISAWSPVDSFQNNGAPATMLANLQNMKMDKPDYYSPQEVRALLSDYSVENKEPDVMPNVIVIMNESLSDLKNLGEFESEEYLSYYYGMENYVMKGNVYVSAFGGGTCNSEFEMLTGSTLSSIGSGVYPYQSYELANAFSLPAEFVKRGYETVAFHPYQAQNWNRIEVYDEFGFQKYLSEEDMSDFAYVSWTVSDECNYEKVKEIYDSCKEPLFLFNVTMQNHGGYDVALHPDVELISVEKQYSSYNDLINYLTLVRESDIAFKNLIDYFLRQDEPVIVCMFGDHQPALNEDFMSEVAEERGNEVEQNEAKFITPYIIWSNYETEMEQQNLDLSLNYLGAYLMKAAGLETEYTNYLIALSKKIPIINGVGYQTADGIWHSLEEEHVLIDEYEKVQYYELFEEVKN